MAWSAPINIVRYSNGTLVKLTASAERFVSYNYDPKDGSGTYTPGVITVTASFEGDVKYGHWEASSDGQNWNTISNGDYGITLTSTGASVPPTSSLFGERNSYFMLKMVGDDGEHYDTVTISREVDPTVVYRKSYTDFVQTNDKIALIASAEQLAQFSTGETMKTVMDAELSTTAESIKSTVSKDISLAQDDLQKQIGSVELRADGLTQRIGTVEEQQTEDGKILAEHSTQLEQMDDKFVLTVNFTEDKLLSDGTKKELQNLQNNFTFGDDGLAIGRTDSEITSLFSNDELSFMSGYGTDGETKLAWISSDGFGTNKLSIGNATGTGLRWNIMVSEDGAHLKFTRRL